MACSMRLLFAIVHYYKAGDGRHGSLAADPRPRIDALRRLILQLHRLYGAPAGLLNHRQRCVERVDDCGGPIDLRICITGDCHVLNHLSDCEGSLFEGGLRSERLLVCSVLKHKGFCSRPVLRLKLLVSPLITSLSWRTIFSSPMQISS